MGKIEAAYHEAGYAALAALSRYHFLARNPILYPDGAGVAPVSPSKKKCLAAGIEINAISYSNKELSDDLALIYSGGYVAELLASKLRSDVIADRDQSVLDYEAIQKLRTASGLELDLSTLENRAADRLTREWGKAHCIAMELLEYGSAEVYEVADLMNNSQ